MKNDGLTPTFFLNQIWWLFEWSNFSISTLMRSQDCTQHLSCTKWKVCFLKRHNGTGPLRSKNPTFASSYLEKKTIRPLSSGPPRFSGALNGRAPSVPRRGRSSLRCLKVQRGATVLWRGFRMTYFCCVVGDWWWTGRLNKWIQWISSGSCQSMIPHSK